MARGQAQKSSTQTFQIYCGNAEHELERLPEESVQCAVTSPPYWGVREYGVQGEIGREATLEEYIDRIVNVLKSVLACLKKDGVMWLIIGDSYTSSNRRYRAVDRRNQYRQSVNRPKTPEGLKPKELVGIPWRVALELQSIGYFLRQECIWEKPNAMPESVRDRPHRVHEHMFLLTKSKKYKFHQNELKKGTGLNVDFNRSVWAVGTRPAPAGCMASFPPALIDPCIRSSTDAGDIVLDPFCGSGTVGEVSLQLNRKFFGIDINKEYTQKALRRLKRVGTLRQEI